MPLLQRLQRVPPLILIHEKKGLNPLSPAQVITASQLKAGLCLKSIKKFMSSE